MVKNKTAGYPTYFLRQSEIIPSDLTMVALMIIIIIINNYLRSVLQLCCDEMEEKNDSGILNLILSVLNCVDLYSIVDHRFPLCPL